MTTAEMMAALEMYETLQNESARNEHYGKVNQLVKYGKIIESRLDEIKALAPVVEKLRSLGIGNYDYNLYNEFETNGIKHNLGFKAASPREKGWHYVAFGNEAGGADGYEDCFLAINKEKWSDVWLTSLGRYPMCIDELAENCAENIFVSRSLERMANGGIDQYIASVNATILKLSQTQPKTHA